MCCRGNHKLIDLIKEIIDNLKYVEQKNLKIQHK
jgi:hypothetical protein